MTELESGAVKNETVTEYKAKDKEGVVHTERVTKNKDTGEIKRELDGKPCPAQSEKPKVEGKKPVVLRYSPSNADFIQIKLQEMILNQLKEMNFYMRIIANKLGEVDDAKLKEMLNNG